MSSQLVPALLGIACSGGAVCAMLVLYSIWFPDSRVWPVPSREGRASGLRVILFRGVGAVIGVSALCLFSVAALDFESLAFPFWLRAGLGGLLFGVGAYLAGAGYLRLGAEISGGTPGEIQETGPYRFSRNPQYVGTVGGGCWGSRCSAIPS